MQARRRIVAGPHVECAGLYNPHLRLRAPELKLIAAQRELERLRFARFERDAPEAFELPHGPRSRSCALMDVDLRNGIPRHRTRIRHFNLGFGCFACLDVFPAESQMVELEARIAEPVPEWK